MWLDRWESAEYDITRSPGMDMDDSDDCNRRFAFRSPYLLVTVDTSESTGIHSDQLM